MTVTLFVTVTFASVRSDSHEKRDSHFSRRARQPIVETMNSYIIKQLAHDAGFDACGITTPDPMPDAEEKMERWLGEGKHGGMKYLEDYKKRSEDFWSRFPWAKSIIVLGLNYYSDGGSRGVWPYAPTIANQSSKTTGRIARYARGKDYHWVIRKKLQEFSVKIRERGDCEIHFEEAVDTKPILEKPLAVQAGLGFIGKQTQLLSLGFGPWLFLSELITDLELEPDQPFEGSCGSCRICIDECPTGAIEEGGGIDARKCISYLTIENKGPIPEEFREKIGDRVFGCDECLNVCPYTAKQKEARCEELKPDAGAGQWLDLKELFEIKTQGEYERKFRGTALLRANRRQMFRNASAVLANFEAEKETRKIL